jgi:hypothetical protein
MHRLLQLERRREMPKTIVVNDAERDALAQVIKRHGQHFDKFEMNLLEELLKKMS